MWLNFVVVVVLLLNFAIRQNNKRKKKSNFSNVITIFVVSPKIRRQSQIIAQAHLVTRPHQF